MFKKILMMLFVLMLSGAAKAQQGYVGFGVSKALEKFDNIPGVDFNNTYQVDMLLGYKFNPNFAIEGEAGFLGSFSADSFNSSDNLENTSTTVSAKVLPWTGPIQPFATAGIGIIHLNSAGLFQQNTTNWATVLGGGVDFVFTKNVTVEFAGKYHVPQGDLDSFRYWTLGANVQLGF